MQIREKKRDEKIHPPGQQRMRSPEKSPPTALSTLSVTQQHLSTCWCRKTPNCVPGTLFIMQKSSLLITISLSFSLLKLPGTALTPTTGSTPETLTTVSSISSALSTGAWPGYMLLVNICCTHAAGTLSKCKTPKRCTALERGQPSQREPPRTHPPFPPSPTVPLPARPLPPPRSLALPPSSLLLHPLPHTPTPT